MKDDVRLASVKNITSNINEDNDRRRKEKTFQSLWMICVEKKRVKLATNDLGRLKSDPNHNRVLRL